MAAQSRYTKIIKLQHQGELLLPLQCNLPRR